MDNTFYERNATYRRKEKDVSLQEAAPFQLIHPVHIFNIMFHFDFGFVGLLSVGWFVDLSSS